MLKSEVTDDNALKIIFCIDICKQKDDDANGKTHTSVCKQKSP